MNLRKTSHADVPTIDKLLDICKLPSNGCAENIKNFIVVEEKGNIIGVGGIETYGAIGLLRSIAVMPKYRGKGIAKKIYRQIENNARDSGIATLYLLTESAIEFFKQLEFIVQERSKAPPSIMDTQQFKELCPSSATLMFCKI